MRVFYELTHTACDREIMRCGHEFDVLHPTWDESGRPKPSNVRLVKGPEARYDIAIVGFERGLRMCPPGVPMIWKSMVDFGNWPAPSDGIMSRLAAWVALCQEGVDRFGLRNHKKALYIEPGIDSDVFFGWEGRIERVLTVGNLLAVRQEKGPQCLSQVAAKIPLSSVGVKNEGIPNVTPLPPAKSMEDLAAIYRSFRAYFNPCGVVCCALLEAMATGLPVVTMKPGNFISLMKHRENCLIAESIEEAVGFLQLLFKDPEVGKALGKNARESVKARFHPSRIADRWGKLMERTVS